VSDPYDGASPVHTWSRSLSAQLLAARLGVPFAAIRVVHNGSGRVTSVQIGNISFSGQRMMRLLRLRSTWFTVGELTLTSSRSSVVFGRRVDLMASARGVGGASLQRLTPSGWVTVRRVRSRRVAVAPRAYTIYRLTAGRVRGPEVAVSVAPFVRVHPTSRTLLAGQVLPRPTGAVTVWRYAAGGWRIVARPQLNARGVFRTRLRIRPGGYRIEVAGDGRLAPATRTVRVTSRLLASLH
jgi:hypothetical protein